MAFVWESVDSSTALSKKGRRMKNRIAKRRAAKRARSEGNPDRPVIMRTGMGPIVRSVTHARLLAAQQAGIAEAMRVQRRCDAASSGWSGDYNPSHGGDPECRPVQTGARPTKVPTPQPPPILTRARKKSKRPLTRARRIPKRMQKRAAKRLMRSLGKPAGDWRKCVFIPSDSMGGKHEAYICCDDICVKVAGGR